MDFRSLQYFLTVAKELNITRAAEKLNINKYFWKTAIKRDYKGLAEDTRHEAELITT